MKKSYTYHFLYYVKLSINFGGLTRLISLGIVLTILPSYSMNYSPQQRQERHDYKNRDRRAQYDYNDPRGPFFVPIEPVQEPRNIQQNIQQNIQANMQQDEYFSRDHRDHQHRAYAQQQYDQHNRAQQGQNNYQDNYLNRQNHPQQYQQQRVQQYHQPQHQEMLQQGGGPVLPNTKRELDLAVAPFVIERKQQPRVALPPAQQYRAPDQAMMPPVQVVQHVQRKASPPDERLVRQQNIMRAVYSPISDHADIQNLMKSLKKDLKESQAQYYKKISRELEDIHGKIQEQHTLSMQHIALIHELRELTSVNRSNNQLGISLEKLENCLQLATNIYDNNHISNLSKTSSPSDHHSLSSSDGREVVSD